MKFISFGSGSSGNCYYLQESGYGILIDAGVGIRSIKKGFRDYGLTLSSVKAILLTHDHTDHTRAVGALSTEFNIPVYAAALVHKSIETNYHIHKKVPAPRRELFEAGATLQLGPFSISAFAVPHDSASNSGYFITTATTNFCLMTDMGTITDEMKGCISRAENLVIESNYDAAMLDSGPYPARLKARIRSGRGHSSNAETALALRENLTAATKRIWLCHLSAENNHPELARKTMESVLADLDDVPQLTILKRRLPSEIFEL